MAASALDSWGGGCLIPTAGGCETRARPLSLAGDMGSKGGASEEADIGQMGGAVGTVVSLGPPSLGRAQAPRSSWGHLGGVVPLPDPVRG